MYGNVRNSNIQATQGVVPIEEVQQIVEQLSNPIKPKKTIEGDGGAYRAYCYNILNKSHN